jgi:hypothetical protein
MFSLLRLPSPTGKILTCRGCSDQAQIPPDGDQDAAVGAFATEHRHPRLSATRT